MAGTAHVVSAPETDNVWLEGLLWGTQWSSDTPRTVISTYIAGRSGREWISDGGWDGEIRVLQPLAKEVAAKRSAMDAFEAVCNVDFATAPSKRAADLVWASVPEQYAPKVLGWANPPGFGYAYGEDQSLVAVNGDRYSDGPSSPAFLAKGSYDYSTYVHELGHALGLAHPHDDGGTSSVFPGVGSVSGDTGDYGMNQGLFTMMTYNDGWWDRHGGDPRSLDWGFQSGPMALDIAALQAMYGANLGTRTGNDSYRLPEANKVGTAYSCIWDAGGLDTILGASSRSNTIDLRAATLGYEEGGGGWLSGAAGVEGGFTIANGVVIENATGGRRGDELTGNAVGNLLTGRGGDDVLWGNDGNDDLRGLGAADTLDGGTGNDRLDGGGGRDALSGGWGDDGFVFRSSAEAGDRIADFGSTDGDRDRIEVDASGFGGGLSAGGTLAAERFQVRDDNLAQDADDRFVFRTTDATLWFDRNGDGAGGLVLVAELQAGASLTSEQILLV